MKKTIMILSTNRADFAHLKLIYETLKTSDKFNIILTISGSHFDKKRGESFKEFFLHSIIPDYRIKLKFDFSTNVKSVNTIISFTKRLKTLIKLSKTDYILVMGDRIELFALCNLAMLNIIKLIHLCGGETTEGVIDDYVRNTLSIVSEFHFVSGEIFKKRLIQIRGNEKNIFIAGEPVLELINKTQFPCFDMIIKQLELNLKKKKYIMCTFHPETNTQINIKKQFDGLLSVIKHFKMPVVCSAPNLDNGGDYILKKLQYVSNKYKHIYYIPNLGFLNYTVLLKNAFCGIGNSSTMIIDAPFLRTPSVLIGMRQRGRPIAKSIIQCDYSEDDIKQAILKINKLNIDNNFDLKYEYRETSKIIKKLLEEKL